MKLSVQKSLKGLLLLTILTSLSGCFLKPPQTTNPPQSTKTLSGVVYVSPSTLATSNDAGNVPLAGATISVQKIDSTGKIEQIPNLIGTTDDNGRYTLIGLPIKRNDERYLVVASKGSTRTLSSGGTITMKVPVADANKDKVTQDVSPVLYFAQQMFEQFSLIFRAPWWTFPEKEANEFRDTLVQKIENLINQNYGGKVPDLSNKTMVTTLASDLAQLLNRDRDVVIALRTLMASTVKTVTLNSWTTLATDPIGDYAIPEGALTLPLEAYNFPPSAGPEADITKFEMFVNDTTYITVRISFNQPVVLDDANHKLEVQFYRNINPDLNNPNLQDSDMACLYITNKTGSAYAYAWKNGAPYGTPWAYAVDATTVTTSNDGKVVTLAINVGKLLGVRTNFFDNWYVDAFIGQECVPYVRFTGDIFKY